MIIKHNHTKVLSSKVIQPELKRKECLGAEPIHNLTSNITNPYKRINNASDMKYILTNESIRSTDSYFQSQLDKLVISIADNFNLCKFSLKTKTPTEQIYQNDFDSQIVLTSTRPVSDSINISGYALRPCWIQIKPKSPEYFIFNNEIWSNCLNLR